MDARERLRRYLEQRRELGESEFMLDSLSVEEALQRLGAPRGTGAPAPEAGSSSSRPSSGAPPRPASPAPLPPAPPAPPLPPARDGAEAPPAGAGADWRAALGRTPPSPVAGDAARGGGRGAAEDRSAGAGASPRPDDGSDPWPAWIEALGVPLGVSRALPPVPPAAAALASVEEVAAAVAACTGCGLHRSARSHVPGEGPPQADLMCIGEAPGADEDVQGRPFVGEAGQLLTKILAAINVSRDDVYICNVLKHRPPGNRDPETDEMQACLPFLWRQVALVRPRVIIVLGRIAAQAVTGSAQGIGALRGRVHRLMGIPVVATYHPAALLRNEAWKRPTWEDVKLAQRLLLAAREHDGRGPAGAGASA